MTIAFSIKQGVTFPRFCQYQDDLGQNQPLTGITLTSQIKNHKGFTVTLIITVIDELAGTFSVEVPAGTLDWPVGIMYWDIRECINGVYNATKTIALNVEWAPTTI